MSPTWPTVPISATSVAAAEHRRDDGDVEQMAGAEPGVVGDQHVAGRSVSGGNFASSALTARGRVRLNTGIARGECASDSPSASSRSQAKSCASETISEKAVRQMVCHISSTTVTSRLHMISSETGSASISATACCQRRLRGDRARPARRRGRCRCASVPAASTVTLSPGGMTVVASRSSMIAGPGDARAGRQGVAVVDRRLDEAVAEPGARGCPSARCRPRRAPASVSDSCGNGPRQRTRNETACTPTPAIDRGVAGGVGAGEALADRRQRRRR